MDFAIPSQNSTHPRPDPTIEAMHALVRDVMPERVTRLERIVCALIQTGDHGHGRARPMPTAAAELVEFARQIDKSIEGGR